jgi:2-polyprenyl-6-methoxyphenol hydroxylase-like FAD-dependent oxidoreductase
MSRQVAFDDPQTKRFAEKNDELVIWYGRDRRVVMYPCDNNQTLNFVCIHPREESEGTNDDWNREASKANLLKVYEGFGPALVALLDKANADSLKVWELLDMDPLPTWISENLALLGDAAHPFLPHQGQGAGCAMEDAAALAAVLQKGVTPKEIPERLKLYEKIRLERAHKIQDYSRIAGRDLTEDGLDSKLRLLRK